MNRDEEYDKEQGSSEHLGGALNNFCTEISVITFLLFEERWDA